MASKINADEFVDREGEGKPTLPKGVVLSGVTTITTAVVAENEVANSTGINVGIITSTHFAGNLTGDVNAGIVTVTSQSVIGSGITISASGIHATGVISATSYAGSGANLTGVGATIMIWEYNPDPGDMLVPFATGIGITFNQKIKAGSGNITLRKDSSSGTVVENFGIGSSVTITNNSLTIDPTSDLEESQVYHLSYPSGVITNMAGESYVGTAYTFQSLAFNYELFTLGNNEQGRLGLNASASSHKSSPVQVPGTAWKNIGKQNYTNNIHSAMIKSDGTLWVWGYNSGGQLGQNDRTDRSSPVQIPGSWSEVGVGNAGGGGAIKTDGTLWAWGLNSKGQLGQNSTTHYSSPVQIPGTTWSKVAGGSEGESIATKTDGTCWTWGNNENGELGQNNRTLYSSPTQLAGTTWNNIVRSARKYQMAIKTDGTLWAFGYGHDGVLAQNNQTKYSSPVQIPGTTWASISCAYSQSVTAIKTDGTLWVWGDNNDGGLGLHDPRRASSPVQIPGTDWSVPLAGEKMGGAIKTTGECWVWGQNNKGQLGQNNQTYYSSPVQIPGTAWNDIHAMKEALILQTKS